MITGWGSNPSSMDVPARVHIIPLGYERDRIIEPPIDLNADKVILLNYAGVDAANPEYHDEVREELEAADVVLEERDCDIFELYSALGMIAELITDHEGDEVYVNLATGSKVTAIAGMIACMATGGTPYYVRAERYGPEGESPPEEPVSYGVAGTEKLSGYPIDRPSEQDIRVLDYLDREGPASKKELIEFGRQQALDFLADVTGETKQGDYRRLETHVLDGLKENGYVVTEKRGRETLVELTSDGRNTLRAFSYLLE